MNYLLLAALALTLAYAFRQRREYRRSCDELPTGLCVISADNRIELWNKQMSRFSGIAAQQATGQTISTLPGPWDEALTEALADPRGRVIKYALEGENPSWVILHTGDSTHPGARRQVLVEDISDYQRLQDELLHKERLASIGRLAAGVAHEIGNPVTGIACVAQNLADSTDRVELEQGTAEILKQTRRISRIVTSLMQFSHPGSAVDLAQCVPCNVADCIDEAIHLLSLDREVSRLSFDNRCNRESLVLADNQLLLQVAVNLLDNARAATDEGTVIIDCERDGERLAISIDNPGEPIPSAILDQVFEPFFTTREVGSGTGLGLPLVASMLQDMNGRIALQSPSPALDGRGTRATVSLPEASYAESFAPGTA